MKKLMMTAAAAFLAMAGAASATTISISAFDTASFLNATKFNGFVVQDFEEIGAATGAGQLPGPLDTNVGTFSVLGGTGTGSTCDASLGAPCDNLFLSNLLVNGQGNSVPDNGVWSLNANGTLGMMWEAVKGEGGSLFNRVVFAIMDAADKGAVVTVEANGATGILSNLLNANRQLIVIDFSTLVDTATISIASSKLNDSFSIDGASVGVVPLPAGGLLLLTGFGVLALRRRRQVAKAV